MGEAVHTRQGIEAEAYIVQDMHTVGLPRFALGLGLVSFNYR